MLKKIIIFSLFIISSCAFADDLADPYQNSGMQNIAYGYSRKFYLGLTLGYGFASEDKYSNEYRLSTNSFNLGTLIGLKFNDYFALEIAMNKMGHIDNQANVYNISPQLVLYYPFITALKVTADLYILGGYGLATTHFNDGLKTTDDFHGAWDAGLGLQTDFSNNVSLRLGYQIYQVYYPTQTNGDRHFMHTVSLGVIYSFGGSE